MERTEIKMLYKWLVIFIIMLIGTNVANYYFFPGGADPDPGADEDSKTIIRYEPKERMFESETAIFWEALESINDHYFYPVDINELIEGAVRGMIDTLDDSQVRFYDPGELEEFLLDTRGSYGGVGIRVIETDEEIIVFEIFPDTPAERSGLNPGDLILEADGYTLSGKGLERAVELLRGPSDTSVNVKIQRPGAEEPIELTITREEIQVTTVFSEMLDEGLGYINITSFESNTAGEFIDSFHDMEQKGLNKGLILDLRNNRGGQFDQAVAVAKQLVPEGEIARLLERDHSVREVFHSSAAEKPYPIVVLINAESASASELLAGALQDREAAYLVGQTTYGKASVQRRVDLSGGNALMLTVYKYLTPSGNNIDKHGITPDFKVDMPEILSYYRYFHPGRLDVGDFGADVEMLQDILKQLGYKEESTGYFDEQTAQAISAFQLDAGIEPSGVFDDVTWVELRQALDIVSWEQDEQLNYARKLIGKTDLWNKVGGNE